MGAVKRLLLCCYYEVGYGGTSGKTTTEKHISIGIAKISKR